MKHYELICIVSGEHATAPDAQTQCVHARGFTAILSKTPRKAISLPVSRAEAAKDAARRQKLFEALLPKATVLVAAPRQWLTLPQAAACLTANTTHLGELCARLQGQVQFQISVTWDASQVLAQFRTSPELAALFSSETPSAQVLERSVDKLRARLREQIHTLIAPACTDIAPLPMAGEMLSNMAVLLPETGEFDLDRAVEAVDAIWSDGLSIRQIGPSAAGSFALLDLEWIAAEAREAAFETLGLSQTATPQEIRAARKLALMRPDAQAEVIKRAAEIAEFARTAAPGGVHRITVLSEAQGHAQSRLSEVA